MLVVALFIIKKQIVRTKLITLLLSLTLLLWLQGNVLIWKYGPLRGETLSSNVFFIIADAMVWIGLIGIFWLKSGSIMKYAILLSGVLVATQFISTEKLFNIKIS